MSGLKGLFIKEETTKPAAKTAASVVTPTIPTITTPPVVQGVSDNKYIDLLEKAVQQGAMAGQDYLKFKEAVENMSKLPLDEKTKFISVYSILSSMGCKKEELLNSVDHYINVIENEKLNFNNELKAEFSAKVQSKLNAINQAKKDLDALTKKITDLTASIQQMSQEASEEQLRINTTEANFKASADIITNEMISDKQKINTYIQ